MVGDNIKKIRLQRNMSQSELAEAVHVKRQTVSSWEVNRTEPNMGIIELLAGALRCRKSDLIGEDAVSTRDTSKLSFTEDQLIRAFRMADPARQKIIMELLGIEKR